MKKMTMDYCTFSLIVAVLAAQNDCICENLRVRNEDIKDLNLRGASAGYLLKSILGKKNFLHLVGMFEGYQASIGSLPHGNSNEMLRQLKELEEKGEIVVLSSSGYRPAGKVRIYPARKKVRK